MVTVTPAHAGGPGSVYVSGTTYAKCQTNLSAAIIKARKAGAEVTGVYNCLKGGSDWTGGFVANY